MKNVAIALVAGLLTITSCDAQKGKGNSKNMEMKTEIDSVSYALGVNIGSQIKTQFKDIDLELLSQAIKDAYADELKMTPEEAGPMLQAYAQQAQQRIADENLKEGEEFLAKNGKRKEVTTTESGLQYEVMNEGVGEKPTSESQVKVHYHGTLIDGTVFDSSVERNQPATFGVTQVIPGWTEALQLMSVGAKWKIYLPANIAYGERGAGASIGPNSTLIFEVELLEIL